MSTEQLNGYILIFGALIQMGRHTVEVIKSIFVSAGLTEAEINEILTAVEVDATRRRAISAAIAFGVEPVPVG